MDYYSRKEVSNSDLSWLKNQLYPKENLFDPTDAYRFGNLIDAMLTENDTIDYFMRSLANHSGQMLFSAEEFTLAEKMKDAFLRDQVAMSIYKGSDGQKIMNREREFELGLIRFTLPVRCKWDIWQSAWGWGGDIKSTTATTQSQFEAACRHFDYDRQRAWYMDIANSDRDVLIGISKKNLKIFKVYVKRGDSFYESGKEKYLNLAYKWWALNPKKEL